MAQSYFISIRTQPRNEPNGMGAMVILYDVSSEEAATIWARNYANELILNDHPQQEISELKVLPVRDFLLTQHGMEPIHWPSFSEEAKRAKNDNAHSVELGSSMAIFPGTPYLGGTPLDIEEIKKRIPKHERWNWDPEIWLFYVAYNEDEAFVIQAMNIILASQIFVMQLPETAAKGAQFKAWPHAKPFESR